MSLSHRQWLEGFDTFRSNLVPPAKDLATEARKQLAETIGAWLAISAEGTFLLVALLNFWPVTHF